MRRLEAVEGYAVEAAATARSLFANDVEPVRIARVIASLNDALTAKLLWLAEDELGSPPCPYAWIALGSEGRMEQVLVTDQDDALVYGNDTDQTTQLGTTGLKITRVGFGAWAIGGGGYEGGWGPQDDEDSIAAIRHALALGVNWIDTAAHYGFGHSERVIGRALAGVEPRPYVFTKGGLPEGPGRTKTRSLRRDSLAARGGGQPRAPRRRGHRPLPDPLAGPR